jgi:hypothetical protein
MTKFTYLATPYIVHTDAKIGGLRWVFDVEADELLDKATVIHCVVISNLDTDEIFEYGPRQIPEALAHLTRFDCLVGHNATAYDLPLLHKLHHWKPKAGCTIIDTLVASRTILPHLDDLDDQAAAMGDPSLGKLRGRHSLESWGARLGISKVGVDITDFSKWSPELQARCVGDVLICKKLWQFLQPDGYSQQALKLEHRVAAICDQITKDGVPFDLEAAERRRQQWTVRRAELEAQLSQQFAGTNLNSRTQIASLLEARGWVPQRRTKKTNKAQIDDEVLEVFQLSIRNLSGSRSIKFSAVASVSFRTVRRLGSSTSVRTDAFTAQSNMSARRMGVVRTPTRTLHRFPTLKGTSRSPSSAVHSSVIPATGFSSLAIRPDYKIAVLRII